MTENNNMSKLRRIDETLGMNRNLCDTRQENDDISCLLFGRHV